MRMKESSIFDYAKKHTTAQCESATDRFQRYEKAADLMMQWTYRLDLAYRNTIPDRANFRKTAEGQVRSFERFDSTAEMSVKNFANNIQSILMPPQRKWAYLSTGTNFDSTKISEVQKDNIERELEDYSNILFKAIRRSNFDLEVNSALQDMAISTGVLLINPGDKDNPFYFNAVPISDLAVEKGPLGNLENFWWRRKFAIRDIQRMWPEAELSNEWQNLLSTNPGGQVEVIIGTIYYPNNPENQRYFYYVQACDNTRTDLYTQYRRKSPWIGFRWCVRTDETLGYGPVLDSLNFIRVLNKMVEFQLKAAQWRAYPSYMVVNDKTINMKSLQINPATLISVGPDFINSDPIRPIQTNGDPQFGQMLIQDYQNQIKQQLFANPLPPINLPGATATEIAIQQQNWIRSAGTAFGRLMVELLNPLVEKCVDILQELGLLPAHFTINGDDVSIRYDSPVIQLQNMDDFTSIQQYVQFFQQVVGPQAGPIFLQLENMASVISEKLNVDKAIVPKAGDMVTRIQSITNAVQQQITGPNAQAPQSTPIAPPQPFVQPQTGAPQ